MMLQKSNCAALLFKKQIVSISNVLLQRKQGIRYSSWFNRKIRSFGEYEVIDNPGNVLQSPREISSHILRPPYGPETSPSSGPALPEIKTISQIKGMKEACSLARNTLNHAKEMVKVGTTTEDIDKWAHDYIISNGAYPSPLYYRGFPKSICTSINNVVCHGIPDDRPLKNGDIINIDVTVYLNGFHGDVSETFAVGEVDKQGKDLIDITKKCLYEGLEVCHPGRPFNLIGTVIEKCARKHGYRVVPAFTGHGIGEYFHGPPDIYHFKNNFPGIMEVGQTFTIEPAISQGTHECIILDDGWTAITSDGSRAAQFEHTILITPSGCEVLTESAI